MSELERVESASTTDDGAARRVSLIIAIRMAAPVGDDRRRGPRGRGPAARDRASLPAPRRVSWSRFSTIREQPLGVARRCRATIVALAARSSSPWSREERRVAVDRRHRGPQLVRDRGPRNSSLTAFDASRAAAVARSASSAASRSVTSTSTLTAPIERRRPHRGAASDTARTRRAGHRVARHRPTRRGPAGSP